MAQQKVVIKVPESLSKTERTALAVEIINFIRKRTAKGKDKDNKNFPKHKTKRKGKKIISGTIGKYSASYVKSSDFKNAGKSSRLINMELSGDMMGELSVLNVKRKGELTIGYKNGTPENSKAEGNIKGTYGNSKRVQAPRNFLGITREDLKKVTKKTFTKAETVRREIRDEVAKRLEPIVASNVKNVKKKGKDVPVDVNLDLTLNELRELEEDIG